MLRKGKGEATTHMSLRQILLLSAETLVPILLYVFLLASSKAKYGLDRILGWDSLAYAFSAQESLAQGLLWTVKFWGHLNVYAMVLAALSFSIDNISILTNVLPIVLVALLALATARLARKITNETTALLAILLTITSMATFRLFVDLHRALLAFVAVTFLVAMDSPRTLSKARLGRHGLASLALLFIVAFSEFEIYLAYIAASVVRMALLRERVKDGAVSIGWSLTPGALFLLTASAWQISTSLLDLSFRAPIKPLTLEITLLYLSTVVMLPFLLLGFVRLLGNWKSRGEGVSTLLLSWVVTLVLILLIFGVILEKISTFRALILMHSPLLVAYGVQYTAREIPLLLRKAAKALPSAPIPSITAPMQTSGAVFAITATALIAVSGIGLYENTDRFLVPIISEDLHSRLIQSSRFVVDRGWPEPLYLVSNQSLIEFLPPIRFELGLLNGPTFFYYGDMNLLPWMVPPDLVDPGATETLLESRVLSREHKLVTDWLDSGSLGLLSHPIIVLSPELFPRTLPSSFQQFRVDEGIYVIPPDSLSLQTFLNWEIIAEEDSYDLGEALAVSREWSETGRVVEIYTEGGYEISFPHYFPATGSYTISVHLFDFPKADYNTTIPLSPLELLIGDEVIDTLVYGRNEVMWWNVSLDISSGFDLITLRAARDDLPFRLSLDVIVVAVDTN